MKIISRFRYEGKDCYNVAYDDGGCVEPVSIRGLYEEEKIEGLTASGYKYRDYHGDIITPSGERIVDLVESPCTASLKQLQDMKEIEENSSYVLTEAEAARYFDRTMQVENIALAQPVEVVIHTREELMDYLQKYSRVSGCHLQDFRPLNAITAPEALFTPEEMVTDDTVREMLVKVAERRTLKSLDAYNGLVVFLKKYAGLRDGFKPEELVRAYLTWGVCGLRFNITSIREKQDVSASISEQEELDGGVSKAMDYVGKRVVYALFDKGGNLYTRTRRAKWGEEDESDVSPTSTDEETSYYRSLRAASNWSTKYRSVRAIEKVSETRVYIDGVNDEGVKVHVKVEPATIAVFVSGKYIMQYKYLRLKTLDGEPAFYEVDTPEKMTFYNLTKAAVRKIIRQRTVKCPVHSTVEMLQNAGLSSVSCARYIGRKVGEVDGSSYTFLPSEAWKYYKKGPDMELLRGFGVQDAEYGTMGELVGLLMEQRDVFEEEGRYPVTKETNDIAPSSQDLALYDAPIEQLEFVQDIVDRQMTIGQQLNGRRLDSVNMESEIISLVKTAIRVELEQSGQDLNLANIASVLRRILNGELIDIETAVHERKHECKGYLKDQATFYTDVRNSAIKLIWVTKVFREIGNMPAEDLRHYMFECMEFPLNQGSREEAAYEALCAAMEKEVAEKCPYGSEQRAILTGSMPFYVNSLIFALIFKKVPYRVMDGMLFTEVNVKNMEGNSLKLEVQVPYTGVKLLVDGSYSDGSALRYCTLCDYVAHEFDGRGRQRVFCVNASVTPWYVVPKGENAIYSYNYLVNYYESAAFRNMPDLLNEMERTCAKVNVIQRSWREHMLFADVFEGLQIEYIDDSIDTVLDNDSAESPYDYYRRWQFKQKAAKEAGKLLKRIPLKSDVMWTNYRTLDDKVMSESLAAEEIDMDDTLRGLSLKDMRVLRVGQEQAKKEIDMDGNKCRRFNPEKCEYEDLLRWTELVRGTFVPKRPCFLVGGSLVIFGDDGHRVVLAVKEISREKMERLADKGIVYRLDARSYFIRAGEDYVLEVV